MKIGFVTDSTADVPADLAGQNGIEIVPALVNIGSDSYTDGIEISRFARSSITGSESRSRSRDETCWVVSVSTPGLFLSCRIADTTANDAIAECRASDA